MSNGDSKFYAQESIDLAEIQKAVNALFYEKLGKLEESKIRAMKEDKAAPIKLDEKLDEKIDNAAIDADIIMGDEK
jgi:hypothetical protein